MLRAVSGQRRALKSSSHADSVFWGCGLGGWDISGSDRLIYSQPIIQERSHAQFKPTQCHVQLRQVGDWELILRIMLG